MTAVPQGESSPGRRVLPPAAFIFHCSRCGSTLLARLFAADPANRVCIEPEVLRNFLKTRGRLQSPEVAREFWALVLQLGADPRAEERRLIVKFHSLAVFQAREIQRVFPEVPCLFLYRDPTEVVASLGRWTPHYLADTNRPALAAALGGTDHATDGYSHDEWLAWYVERCLHSAWEAGDCFADAIDYADFSPRYLEVVNRISATHFSPDDARIAQILSVHSRNIGEAFSRHDDARKVPPGLEPVVARIAGAAYLRWRQRLHLRPRTAPESARIFSTGGPQQPKSIPSGDQLTD